MNRRDFLTVSGALAGVGLLSTAARGWPAAANSDYRPGSKRALMKLGCQSFSPTDANLRYYQRCGVDHLVTGFPPPSFSDGSYAVEDVIAFRKRIESYGINLAVLAVPYPKNAMLGKSPERDEEIARICHLIRVASRAGVPVLKYNLHIHWPLRTESLPGRGGTLLSSWDLSKASREPSVPEAGRVTAEMNWERVTYFLERVIPVAERYRVRMACHPHDTPTPPGFQNVDEVLGTVEGMKKFVSICESEYHGFNFCQGTVAEMLKDPGREIYDVIRYFGERRKIFLVHFRNIRGGRDHFQEVYPDEGDVDMLRAMRVYKEVGYPYVIVPDHVPRSEEDPESRQGYAFCYGYIRALIQAVDG